MRLSKPEVHSAYAFKNPLKRFAARCLDAVGGLIFYARLKKPKPFPSTGAIAVLRLDQLGDVVMAAYFLRELRKIFPQRKIVAVTGSGGGELLKSFWPDDSRIVLDADWFGPTPSFLGSWRAWLELRRLLGRIAPSAVIDLRGDLRHIAAARMSCPDVWIASTGRTGGAFMLDAVIWPSREAHVVEKNMAFLSVFGVGIPSDFSPLITLASEPFGEAPKAAMPVKTGKWIALHPGAGTDAKLWPDRHWRALLESLPREAGTRFIWIGDARASAHAKRIATGLDPALAAHCLNMTTEVPLSQLGTFLHDCDLVISTDSGPAHVAAARGVPVIVVFSGASNPEEWRPLGNRSRVVDHTVECSPCGLKRCPLARRNCMEDLDPARVAASVADLLSCGRRT